MAYILHNILKLRVVVVIGIGEVVIFKLLNFIYKLCKNEEESCVGEKKVATQGIPDALHC